VVFYSKIVEVKLFVLLSGLTL